MSADLNAWLDAAISRREAEARETRPLWELRKAAWPLAPEVNPEAVLRHCAADRKLIADITADQHLVVDDCWYTCAAATEERDGGETCDDTRLGEPCDCGRDARVQRRLRIIAEGYGCQEEPAP
ncbi:hypothetical protein ACWELB_21200 [Streptomyces asiaticus]